MINKLITPDGFMNIETFCKIAVCVFVATMAGVPFALLLVFPSVAMVVISGIFNACMHCFFKKDDLLKISVMNSASVKGFDRKNADETDVIRFLGQIARLSTPEGEFFGHGKKPTIVERASAKLVGGFFGNDGRGRKCSCECSGKCGSERGC